jgi:hypothetical protein
MQHDGWVLAVTGRRQAYLAPCHFLASSPHSLGFHRAPVIALPSTRLNLAIAILTSLLALSSFPRLTLVSRCYVPGCYKTKGARHITTLVTRGTGS